ncbi:MAG: sugar phosphate isomerase/epimerase [Acidobacteriota bacterium]|nr:sugar phosphate isomerase/epimerase [Acidobacteriota bacterium]
MKTLTRRELIATFGSLGAAALAVKSGALLSSASPRPGQTSGRPSSLIGGLQIGCMTWSFRDRPLSQALHDISSIGFSSAELWSGHLDPFKSSDNEIAAWKKNFSDAGVKITSYFVNFGEKFTRSEIRRNFQAGRLLGAQVLSSNVPESLVPQIDRECRDFKMYVGLHNEVYGRPEPNQVQFPADYERIFRRSSKWIGATLDVGHLYAAGFDPSQFIRRHFNRIVSVHLKDENRVLPHYTDFPFGKGPTPLPAILHTLQRYHFRRAANIEWGVEGMDPVKGVAEALAYIRRTLA